MLKSTYQLIICLFLAIASNSKAQDNPILGHFSVSEANGQVYLSWTIIAGSSCDGTRIYRSTDGISFSQIGEILGICGNTSYAQSYGFTDADPIPNTINYYKLELGLTGYSNTVAVEVINIGKNGYQIRPNPVSTTGRIYFDNKKSQLSELTIYYPDGRKLNTLSTKENYFRLDATNISGGSYLFKIASDGNEISGKFVVQ